MAIQGNSVTAAEHDWYATRSSEPADAPLSQHKYGYYISKSIAKAPLSQMERCWLQTVGSSTSNDPYELWVKACQAQSVTVGKTINECKFNFFTSVGAGTNP